MAERRYYRLEDWRGNVYIPDQTAGDLANIHKDASLKDDPGSGMSSDGTIVADQDANLGKAILLSSSNGASKNLLTAVFDNLSFGKYSVTLRMKGNIASGNTEIVRVTCYYIDNSGTYATTTLSYTIMTGETFGVANKYLDLGFITDFRGKFSSSISLKVVVDLAGVAGTTMYMDTIDVQKANVGMAGLNTIYLV